MPRPRTPAGELGSIQQTTLEGMAALRRHAAVLPEDGSQPAGYATLGLAASTGDLT